MMTAMRKHYKKILIGVTILILPSFMFFGIGTSRKKKRPDTAPAVVIDGVSVPIEVYQRRLSRLERTYRQRFGDMWNQEMSDRLDLPKQAYDQMVDEVLMQNEVDRLNIAVSRRAVDDALKGLPDFKTEDGKFDPQKYNEIIGQPGIPWDDIRASLRAQLAMNALASNVMAAVRISPTEIEQEFVRRNATAKVKYLALTPTSLMDEVTVTADDIRAYYDEHTETYSVADQRRVSYVKVPIEPSEADRAAVMGRAEEVLEKARAGNDFAELARQYSDGPSGPRGGDLGTFGKGAMVAEFDQSAFALEPGQVSDLVETRFGIHIIKVEDRSTDDDGKPQVHARHILFKVEPSDETRKRLSEQAWSISNDAGKEDGSLEAAARANDLEIDQSEFFTEKTRYLAGLVGATDIATLAFAMELGEVSEPVELADAYVVFRVDEEQPAHVQPLEEVKGRIEAELKRDRATDLLEPRIRELAGKIKSLDELDEIEPEMAAKVRTSKPFSREKDAPGIVGRSPEFIDAAFTLPEGTLSEPIIIDSRAVALLEVLERTPADMDELDEQKDEIRKSLLEKKRAAVFADWRQSLRDRAIIVRNQDIVGLWEEPTEPSEAGDTDQQTS